MAIEPRAPETPDLAAITIRAATPDDIDVIVPLVNAAYRHTEGHVFAHNDRTSRDDLTKRLAEATVAEAGGKVVGCISTDLSADPAHFGMLAADLSWHGRRIGSTLIAHAEAAARAAGRAAMRIETVKEAGLVPFYERLGYIVVGETPGQEWNGGADWGAIIPWHMVDMEKRL